ncbi:MAG: hypothetical protein Q9190_003035 [Brigantiaea leucoxantha]
MAAKPIFVATHPRACSTAFERIFMTRRDQLECLHEPFGDAFYYGPERLSSRYEDDEEARVNSGFANSTYKIILERIENDGTEGKRLFIKDMMYYLVPPDGKTASIAPSLAARKRGIGTSSISIDHAANDAVQSAVHVEPDPNAENPTVFPQAILEKFHFAFLIRHPRLSVPSFYRCTVPPLDKVTGFYNFMPSEAGYDELRRGFDYLRSLGQIGPGVAGQKAVTPADDDHGATKKVEICVIDADDLLDNPTGITKAFCESVGIAYDPNMLSWSTEEDQEQAKTAFAKWPGFHEDVIDSTELRPRTHTKKGKSDDDRYAEWVEKFGEAGARTIQQIVNANIRDYEYLKQFALKV